MNVWLFWAFVTMTVIGSIIRINKIGTEETIKNAPGDAIVLLLCDGLLTWWVATLVFHGC